MGVGYNSLGYRLYILLKIKKKERQKDSGAATPYRMNDKVRHVWQAIV
jgi:hypothetical protein